MAGKRALVVDKTPVRVVILSLDSHLCAAVRAAESELRRTLPALSLDFHAASEWDHRPAALRAAIEDIGCADIIISSMLFIEEHIRAVLPALKARREQCDAFVGCMSASEIVQLTRLDRFDMSRPASGPIALMKRLKGSGDKAKAGEKQMKTLRRLPKILRYIPGVAQDVRAYFLTMQYWLAGSERNIANAVRFLIDRYAAGPRAHLRGTLNPAPPEEYPDTGLYHPGIKGGVAERLDALPKGAPRQPVVGLLVMRSYVSSGDTGHYDGAIAALEARGLKVIPAFASGLDARAAIRRFFMRGETPTIDALVSLTGFSLVGGPAFNDSEGAVEMLKALDIPYVCALASEFQSLSDWGSGSRGLMPIETTMMVALPELDGATGSIVIGGRADHGTTCIGCARRCTFADDNRRMRSCPERAEQLAARVDRLIRLKRSARASRRVAITLFNFPPNSGSVGTAAHLSVFESLHNFLKRLAAEGYSVDVPATVDDLKEALLEGNKERYGTEANVGAEIPVAHHVRRERRLKDIEAAWGPAPGRVLTDGRALFVLGAQFGNVFVGLQPGFGYEGDPMRLLFEKGFAPTHAFAAYYSWLKQAFCADAVVHFGTHGALEFMPGKQTGLSGDCWPDYLIGDLPNIYFYAANNPSEATIARRRGNATTVSYLTPPVAESGLYRGLSDLSATIQRWRGLDPAATSERADLEALIAQQASDLDLDPPASFDRPQDRIEAIRLKLLEIEGTLIPEGLHVAGQGLGPEARRNLLAAMPPAEGDAPLPDVVLDALVAGTAPSEIAARHRLEARTAELERLARANRLLSEDHEMAALIRALDAGYTPPVPGGDLIRSPDILPSGRNIHGFDPFRLPSAYAVADGRRQADRLIERHRSETGRLPETMAIVLWGTDNLKSEGAQIAQAMALLGATPRFDSYGRLAGADLIPLEKLGRPRIDVMVTLSGIFRDLLPLQTRMLADAAFAAAHADEPADLNFIRKHALAWQASSGADMATAALRVFSNADGAYGANVNYLISAGTWDNEDELGDAFATRKCFAYGRDGRPHAQPALLSSLLSGVEVAYQNLESVETGLTTIDHYFDTLGGISRAATKARGEQPSVYIGDQTRGDGIVRTLAEQVALETRSRTLNPKWYEGMLRHGYEGVRQIEAQVTNTMGWSATTGQVAPWVYQQMTETFVLDETLRRRLSELNPAATANVAGRLIEASERRYWSPDPETLAALRAASAEIEDRLEGITPSQGAAA
ncbi:magnesium chelatase subunit H [Hyphomonas sp.]|uniref:magnesium chelatase subunit H n=1 Tax=Hyphomonas sp. TaxID=87 RepID=UPI003919B6F6